MIRNKAYEVCKVPTKGSTESLSGIPREEASTGVRVEEVKGADVTAQQSEDGYSDQDMTQDDGDRHTTVHRMDNADLDDDGYVDVTI